MLSLFTPGVKRALSSILSASLLAVSLPFTASTAVAAPACANAEAAFRGQDPQCAARQIGNQIVTYPRTSWDQLGFVDMPSDGSEPSVTWLAGGDVKALGNSSASVLELDSADVISMVTQFPTNVPYVFGRYNPITGSLRVDMMKVEETLTTSGKRMGLYRSLFTPKHGDYWKAARQYISPDQFESGTVVGRNPFAPFMSGDSDIFNGVTQEGTQVVLGHAMRFTGAPMAVLQVAIPRINVKTKKSGGMLRKKITTIWTGYLKPSWWIGYPTSVLARDSTQSIRSYCVTDVKTATASCPTYELATSGVAFEEFKGGMLDSTEEGWELRRQVKKGWTFLGLLLIFTVIAFGGFAVLSAVAPAAFATGAGMLNSLFAFTGLASVGAVTGAVGAAGIHFAMAVAGVMLFGGANLGGLYNLDAKFILFGIVSSANNGPPTSLDQDTEKLSRVYAEPRTTSDFITGGITLVGWQRTVSGTCGLNQSVEQCGGGTGDGITPRASSERGASPSSVIVQDVIGDRVVRENTSGGSYGGIRR